MKTEQIKMSSKQIQQITDMLKSQGLTFSEINEIVNGNYESFKTDKDLQNVFSSEGNYQSVLRGLSDGYSIEELPKQGVSSKEIGDFIKELEKSNLTVENAKAINQYSNGSNMILSIKRGTADRSEIKNQIRKDMISKLQTRGLSSEKISNIEDYIENLDFDKPVHENYDNVSQYIKEMNMPHNCYASVCTAIKDIDSLEHIDSTISNLEEGLSKTRLPKSMKLYRAIKTNGNINPESYIGKNISDEGYTSTSPLYNSSFAKYDDYDTVMEIYAPKGTQGSYMIKLSDYDNAEQEVLLNPNDIYVIDAKSCVVDENGKNKTVLKGLLLSKDRECYKGIDKEQLEKKEQHSEEVSSNLPNTQNKFSKFFSKVRTRYIKKDKKNAPIKQEYEIDNSQKSSKNNNFLNDLKQKTYSSEEIQQNLESQNTNQIQQPQQTIQPPENLEL